MENILVLFILWIAGAFVAWVFACLFEESEEYSKYCMQLEEKIRSKYRNWI